MSNLLPAYEYEFCVGIKIYNTEICMGDFIAEREWIGYTLDQVTKWKWYFRYIAALIQIRNPRNGVEMVIWKRELKDPTEVRIKHTKNKLRSAKAKVTEMNNKMNNHMNSGDLFPTTHTLFDKAVAKIKEKRLAVKKLTKDLDGLMEQLRENEQKKI